MTDADSNKNNQVSLSLLSGDLGHIFTVNKTGLWITDGSQIEYSTRSEYNLVIQANDSKTCYFDFLLLNVVK